MQLLQFTLASGYGAGEVSASLAKEPWMAHQSATGKFVET